MSDPDQITVTLSREEAEALVMPEGERPDHWRYYHDCGNAGRKIREALQNPQPSDTGRYEEALRERLLSDEAVEALADCIWAGLPIPRATILNGARIGLEAVAAALQPTG